MVTGTPRPLRTATAVTLGRWAARVSRATGLGGGSMIGGRVVLAIDPQALRRLTRGRTVALVSGTNGKTTTTLMLSRALGTHGPVASNSEGANMPDGLVAALVRAPAAPYAVLEVDEPHLPQVADAVSPAVIVLLNLSRDQLDRVGEVRQLEADLRTALARQPQATVVANTDDVLATSAAAAAAHPVWVSAGSSWLLDSRACPRCGAVIGSGPAGWVCRCGFGQPEPDWVVTGDVVRTPAGERVELELGLPGSWNNANAALALAAADAVGVPVAEALPAIRGIGEVDGRYAVFDRGGRGVRLLLAKNPAGWQETLGLVGPGGQDVVVAINAREADGRDLSWLYDIPFEQLRGHRVVATGERVADLAVRLAYAEVPHTVVDDPRAAVDALPAGGDVLANYTAFRDLLAWLRRVA